MRVCQAACSPRPPKGAYPCTGTPADPVPVPRRERRCAGTEAAKEEPVWRLTAHPEDARESSAAREAEEGPDGSRCQEEDGARPLGAADGGGGVGRALPQQLAALVLEAGPDE